MEQETRHNKGLKPLTKKINLVPELEEVALLLKDINSKRQKEEDEEL